MKIRIYANNSNDKNLYFYDDDNKIELAYYKVDEKILLLNTDVIGIDFKKDIKSRALNSLYKDDYIHIFKYMKNKGDYQISEFITPFIPTLMI